MHQRFAIEWLKAFRESAEKVCRLYADDFLFEDLPLGQSITDKDELHRVFAPYANDDPTNGVGIHKFTINEVIGDEHSALIRWSWQAHHADQFLGIPTGGKVVGTTGHTFHLYENGRIKRESTYWDSTSILADMGQPVSKLGVTAPIVG
ncbi:ketosteroid isomerase-related protein [Amycolatopsis thermoflava]|uniref:ketosteroid isomerase-related protein n=1 Tax=Amycolatopsis thermoflava TaxID=84480 RepID=UPI003801DEE9